MKLTLKQFTEIKNQTRKELFPNGEDKYKSKFKSDKYSFSWDFHKAYPPITLRLYFWWKKGEVFGKRDTSALETSPFDFHKYTTLDDDYLKKVFFR